MFDLANPPVKPFKSEGKWMGGAQVGAGRRQIDERIHAKVRRWLV